LGELKSFALVNLVLALYLMLLFMVNLELVFEITLVLVEGNPIACPGVLQMQANLIEVEGDKALQLVSQLVGQLIGQRVSQLADQARVDVEAIEWAHKITKLLLVKLCNNWKYMILQLIMTSIPILGCLIFLLLYIINKI
jgi:hypothetical protein